MNEKMASYQNLFFFKNCNLPTDMSRRSNARFFPMTVGLGKWLDSMFFSQYQHTVDQNMVIFGRMIFTTSKKIKEILSWLFKKYDINFWSSQLFDIKKHKYEYNECVFFKFLTHSEQKPPRKVKVLCKFSMPMDKSFATWGTVTHTYI